MSLKATFYTTASPKNRLEKEVNTDATQSFEVEVNLLYPTDLLRPTLIVDDFNHNDDCFSYNYVKLVFSGTHQITRYYFITGWQILKNNLYQVSLKEDVLMTYEAEILAENVFVERCSVNYSTYIYDTIAIKQYLPITLAPIETYTYTQVVPSGNLLDFREKGLTLQSNNEDNRYAVCVARSGSNNLAPEAPAGSIDGNDMLTAILTNSNYPSVYMYCCSYQTLQALIERCVSNSSDAESIISIAKYPYSLPHGDSKLTTIRLSGKDVSLSDTEERSTFYWLGTQPIVLADFRWNNNILVNSTYKWMNGEASYRMYLPYVGYIDLAVSSFDIGDEIQVVYIPFHPYNITLVALMDVTKRLLLYTSEITLGEQIPLVSSNVQQIRDQWISTGVKVGISSVADIFKFVYGGNLMKVSAVKDAISNITDVTTLALTTHEKDNVRLSSPNTSSQLPPQVMIQRTYYNYVGYGTDSYKMRFGMPMMRFATLSGIQTTSDVFVKTDIQYLPTEIGNDAERNEIISLLNQGIILPAKSSS